MCLREMVTKPIRESAMSTKAMQRQKTFSNGHDLRTQIVYSAATHYFTVHIHWLVVSAFCLTIFLYLRRHRFLAQPRGYAFFVC